MDAGADEGEGWDGSGCSVREKAEEGTKRARRHQAAPLLNSAQKTEEGGRPAVRTPHGAGVGPGPDRRTAPGSGPSPARACRPDRAGERGV